MKQFALKKYEGKVEENNNQANYQRKPKDLAAKNKK